MSLSHDWESLLKQKVEERKLTFILNLLLDHGDVSIKELLTYNSKEKLEKLIDEEIDEHKEIDIKVRTKDKNRFANIVMEVVAKKKQNTMAENYYTHQHTNNPYFTHPTGYSPITNNNVNPTMSLNFPLADDDDILSIGDSFISEQMDIPPLPTQTTKNTRTLIQVRAVTDKDKDENHQASKFKEKMDAAIQKSENGKKHMSIVVAHNSNIIHPNMPNCNQLAQPAMIDNQLSGQYDDDYHDESDVGYIHGAPVLDFEEDTGFIKGAPDMSSFTKGIESTNSSPPRSPLAIHQPAQPLQPQQPIHNGFTVTNGQFHPITPRDFQFQWNGSPHDQTPQVQPMNPGRIHDPLLVQNTLQSVAYYADKLGSLHNEYRQRYIEQQQITNSLQLTDAHMEPSKYHQLQLTYGSMAQHLQNLITAIYSQFREMENKLNTRFSLQLDIDESNQFDRFQRYHDQFQTTQQHLLVVGQQQSAYYSNQPNTGASYQPVAYPPTPQTMQNRVRRDLSISDDQKIAYDQRLTAFKQMAHAKTPRPSQYQQPNNRNVYNNHTQMQYPQTTPANSKKFEWKARNQTRPMQQQARTPREMSGNNNDRNQRKTDDLGIPTMGYVYIGSRMSQLIAHIQLSETEVFSNQSRIETVIHDCLSKCTEFEGFDIVAYGSSTHKLFIKDYSDFDFCIRCKKIKVTQEEGLQLILEKLSKFSKDFEKMEIVSSEKSIHGGKHIRFADSISNRRIDLVLNNLPEIGSSRFIAAYESIDPRFALLCRVVKYWARQRRINDPNAGTLSTYSLVLMVINFLQLRRTLPTLSIMTFDRKSGLSPWSTQDDYQINVQKYRDFASKNEEPHSKLLVNFFNFYGNEFDYKTSVVSVRTGTYLTKSDKKWNIQTNPLCVENPFDSRTNLTSNVDESKLLHIRGEFIRAYKILVDSYKIYEVCSIAE